MISAIPHSRALFDAIEAAKRHETDDAFEHSRHAAELLSNPAWFVDREALVEIAGFAIAATAALDHLDALADVPASVRGLLAA